MKTPVKQISSVPGHDHPPVATGWLEILGLGDDDLGAP